MAPMALIGTQVKKERPANFEGPLAIKVAESRKTQTKRKRTTNAGLVLAGPHDGLVHCWELAWTGLTGEAAHNRE